MMWSQDELDVLNKEDDLFISIPNVDGSIHSPTFIWGVSANDSLYARGASGLSTKWYQAAQKAKRATIKIDTIKKEVTLRFPSDPTINAAISRAYREKYTTYLDLMTSEPVIAATVEMIPVG